MIITPDGSNPAYRLGTGRIGGIVLNRVYAGGQVSARSRYTESSRLYREACTAGIPCQQPWSEQTRKLTWTAAQQPTNPNLYRPFWDLTRGHYLIRYWTGSLWFRASDSGEFWGFNEWVDPVYYGISFNVTEIGFWTPFDPACTRYPNEQEMINALQRVDLKPYLYFQCPVANARLEINCAVGVEPYRDNYYADLTWALCRLPYE